MEISLAIESEFNGRSSVTSPANLSMSVAIAVAVDKLHSPREPSLQSTTVVQVRKLVLVIFSRK